VGPDLRPSHPSLNPRADLADQAALMCDQADAVSLLMVDALEPLDAKECELTRLGYPLRPSKESLRLERYETRLRRVWNEALNEFRRVRAEGYTGPVLTDLLELESEPAPDPEPISPTLLMGPEPEPTPPAAEPSPSDSSNDEFAVSKLLSLVKALAPTPEAPAASTHAAPPQPSSKAKPTAPLNRRARRAQAAKARKAHASAH
ncbi:MAG: hypothetical protein ABI353_13355, partial [Isosphaeraceae bacterium]